MAENTPDEAPKHSCGGAGGSPDLVTAFGPTAREVVFRIDRSIGMAADLLLRNSGHCFLHRFHPFRAFESWRAIRMDA
ncbi:MAG: hypothetical protein HOH66_17495 [Rhodospirillaceae bacterium]|nr:hypothetical protein [Rhodospirillaceae bacterium]MBT6119660.1 hypothetical protein [Rhodospirillaceae bacterium]